jgi:hypothetical protein
MFYMQTWTDRLCTHVLVADECKCSVSFYVVYTVCVVAFTAAAMTAGPQLFRAALQIFTPRPRLPNCPPPKRKNGPSLYERRSDRTNAMCNPYSGTGMTPDY